MVILYADNITGSIQRAMEVTKRRRKKQMQYNEEMGITPTTIKSSMKDILASIYEADYWTVPDADVQALPIEGKNVKQLEEQRREAARRLDFEKAAAIRDAIRQLQ